MSQQYKEDYVFDDVMHSKRKLNIFMIGDSVTLALCRDADAIIKRAGVSPKVTISCAPLYNIMCLEIDGRRKWSRQGILAMGCDP